MKVQNLSVEGYWSITVLYDVTTADFKEVGARLGNAGASRAMIEDAGRNLSGWNAGYTFSNLASRESVVCIGRATSLREFLNTIDHEVDHVQAHVAEYYGVRLGTEQAAYLQGYIGGRLLEFAIKNIIV